MTLIEDMGSPKFNGVKYALGYDTCFTCNFTFVIDILPPHTDSLTPTHVPMTHTKPNTPQ
jgi:hypothetical protein